MILRPNSSLQAARSSTGSVGLLQWDVQGAKMAFLAALVIQELFGLALSTAIPVNTCCPPRHFLAIEDWAESWQDPEGNWKPKSTPAHRSLRSVGSPRIRHILRDVETASERDMLERVYSDRHMAYEFYALMQGRLVSAWGAKYDWGDPKRHDFISRVHCVADKNNMPAIDGATADESNTLGKDEVLQSKGLFPRQCDTESELVCTKVFFFRFTHAVVPPFTALHCCDWKK